MINIILFSYNYRINVNLMSTLTIDFAIHGTHSHKVFRDILCTLKYIIHNLQCFVFDTCRIMQQSIIITNVQNICFDIYRSPGLFDVSHLQWINDRPNALKHTIHDVSKIMFTTAFNEKQCT